SALAIPTADGPLDRRIHSQRCSWPPIRLPDVQREYWNHCPACGFGSAAAVNDPAAGDRVPDGPAPKAASPLGLASLILGCLAVGCSCLGILCALGIRVHLGLFLLGLVLVGLGGFLALPGALLGMASLGQTARSRTTGAIGFALN